MIERGNAQGPDAAVSHRAAARPTLAGRLGAYALPAAFVIYFGAFGGMLSGMSTRPLQIVSVLVLCAAAILFRRRLHRTAALLPLGAIAASQVLSLVIPPITEDGASQVVLWLAVVAVYWVSSAADTETLDASLFAVLVALAFIGLYQALNYWLRVDASSLPPRLGSTLWNPNNLAFAMLLGGALSLLRRRWWALVVFVAALVLTGSLTSFIAGLLGLVTYLLIAGFREIRWRRILPVAVPAGLVLAVLAGLQLVRRLNRQLEVTSLDQRLDLWRVATDMFAQRPLVGMGPGSFKEIYFQTGLVVPGETLQHAHNLYLHVAAETGLIGLLALGWLALAGVLATAAAWRRGERRNAAAGAALFVMLAVHGTLDYVYWIPSVVLLTLWTARVLFHEEPADRPAPSSHAGLRASLLIAEVFLVGLLMFRVTADLDALLEALARFTTALGLLLSFMLVLAIPSRFRSKLLSRRLPAGAHVWRKPR